MTDMTQTSDRVLYIELSGHSRYLANRADVAIDRIVYVTGATYLDLPGPGEAVVSKQPRYELLDVPAQSRIFIETIDPMEEGMVFFRAEEVRWSDGSVERDVRLPMRGRRQARAPLGLIDPRHTEAGQNTEAGQTSGPHDPEPELPTVKRSRQRIGAEPARVVQLGEQGVDG